MTNAHRTSLLVREIAEGVCLRVCGGFDAYSSDLLVSMLSKSKAALYSKEEAAAFERACWEDDGIVFTSKDTAQGLLRLSAVATRKDTEQPAALAVAHVYLHANRGTHPDLGQLLKLHLSIEPGHIHRIGVGLGLHEAVASEMCKQVLAVVAEFQRSTRDDMTILWSFDESLTACESFGLREALHTRLMKEIYAPMLHVTEDCVL